ncbi:MAG: S24/S26 family peptidase [Oscillospiraceae bacterium]|nr:S24/S26 family peptidase [Oscillospiraceae bacterium]
MSEINTSTYKEHLEKYGTLTYRNVGISMMPLLKQGRDIFTVTKKTSERCKKYDVVLYKRPPQQFVLHRVIKVRENDYVILGDNCINKEYGITDNDIIGVMTEFVRKGKKITVNDRIYRLYSFIWVNFSGVRIFLQKLKFKIKSIFKKNKS